MKKENSISETHIINKEEEWLNTIVDASKLAIWDWNVKTGIVKLNKYVAELFGAEPIDFENTIDNFNALIHPDFLENAPTNLDFLLNQKDNFFEYEYKVQHPSGGWKWIYSRGKIVSWDKAGKPLRVSGIHADIDKRKKIEETLFNAQSIQKAVFNALPDLKFRISKKGYYLGYYFSLNEKIDLYKKPSEFLHKKLTEVLPVNVGMGYMANIKRAIEMDEVQNFEYALSINDTLQFFESRISKINDDEVIAVVRNITERTQIQNALKEKIRELDLNNQKLAKYSDSNELLENFAYIASHDLQEPVRTINSFVQLLKDRYKEQLDETANIYINFIEEGANNINQLIEDLLTYSRVNTEDSIVEEIDIKQIIQEIERNLGNFLQQNKAKIITKNLPVSIKASKTKMIQLFQNLISNAVKFRKPNEVPVIKVTAKNLEGHWLFSVKDNGIGIAPEFHEQIFVLFKKLSSSDKVKGSGLGLAICKKIIQQCNGKIWLESEVDKGTTFSFTIKK